MASLVKRGSIWYVKTYLGLVDGKPKTDWVRGWKDKAKTEALKDQIEATARLTKRVAKLAAVGAADGTGEDALAPVAAEVLTEEREDGLDPFLEDIAAYLNSLAAKGDQEMHIRTVGNDLRSFRRQSKTAASEEITRRSVDGWVAALSRPRTKVLEGGEKVTRQYARRTVQRHVASLVAFVNWLVLEGSLSRSPLMKYRTAPIKGHEVRSRRPLTVDEQRYLLSLASDLRDVCLFALRTGARRGQIAALRVRDVSLCDRLVKLKPKGHNVADHAVPVVDGELLELLALRCKGKGGDELVFPETPSRQNAADRLRSHCAEAGVSVDRVDFYSLRHSFGDTLARRGVRPKVLQKLMGHANVETTLRYYTHVTGDDERSAVGLLSGEPSHCATSAPTLTTP